MREDVGIVIKPIGFVAMHFTRFRLIARIKERIIYETEKSRHTQPTYPKITARFRRSNQRRKIAINRNLVKCIATKPIGLITIPTSSLIDSFPSSNHILMQIFANKFEHQVLLHHQKLFTNFEILKKPIKHCRTTMKTMFL